MPKAKPQPARRGRPPVPEALKRKNRTIRVDDKTWATWQKIAEAEDRGVAEVLESAMERFSPAD